MTAKTERWWVTTSVRNAVHDELYVRVEFRGGTTEYVPHMLLDKTSYAARFLTPYGIVLVDTNSVVFSRL
jgi:hypothetical protein